MLRRSWAAAAAAITRVAHPLRTVPRVVAVGTVQSWSAASPSIARLSSSASSSPPSVPDPGAVHTPQRSRPARGQSRRRRSGSAFPTHAKALYDKLEAGVDGMAESNDTFVVTKTDVQFVIDCGDAGSFVLTQDGDEEQLVLQSPKSGVFRYRFDDGSGHWVDVGDGHFLLELLTRDLIHLCRGVPSF